MVLTHVMVLVCVMVLDLVMVLAFLMALVRGMVLYHFVMLARIMVLAYVMVLTLYYAAHCMSHKALAAEGCRGQIQKALRASVWKSSFFNTYDKINCLNLSFKWGYIGLWRDQRRG